MTVKIIAIFAVVPGKDDEFLSAATACVTASRAEAGVLQYELWRESGGERRFVFNELYVDDAAVQHHGSSDHIGIFGKAIKPLLSARPEIVKSSPVDVVA